MMQQINSRLIHRPSRETSDELTVRVMPSNSADIPLNSREMGDRHGTRTGRMLVRRSTLIVECEPLILLFSINVYLLSIALLLDLLLSSRLLFTRHLPSITGLF